MKSNEIREIDTYPKPSDIDGMIDWAPLSLFRNMIKDYFMK